MPVSKYSLFGCWTAILKYCLVLGITVLAGPIAFSANLINMGPDFKLFVDRTDALNSTDAVKIEDQWNQFEQKFQTIYDEAVYRKPEDRWQLRLRASRDIFFHHLKDLAPKMIALFDSGPTLVANQEDKFRLM